MDRHIIRSSCMCLLAFVCVCLCLCLCLCGPSIFFIFVNRCLYVWLWLYVWVGLFCMASQCGCSAVCTVCLGTLPEQQGYIEEIICVFVSFLPKSSRLITWFAGNLTLGGRWWQMPSWEALAATAHILPRGHLGPVPVSSQHSAQ